MGAQNKHGIKRNIKTVRGKLYRSLSSRQMWNGWGGGHGAGRGMLVRGGAGRWGRGEGVLMGAWRRGVGGGRGAERGWCWWGAGRGGVGGGRGAGRGMLVGAVGRGEGCWWGPWGGERGCWWRLWGWERGCWWRPWGWERGCWWRPWGGERDVGGGRGAGRGRWWRPWGGERGCWWRPWGWERGCWWRPWGWERGCWWRPWGGERDVGGGRGAGRGRWWRPWGGERGCWWRPWGWERGCWWRPWGWERGCWWRPWGWERGCWWRPWGGESECWWVAGGGRNSLNCCCIFSCRLCLLDYVWFWKCHPVCLNWDARHSMQQLILALMSLVICVSETRRLKSMTWNWKRRVETRKSWRGFVSSQGDDKCLFLFFFFFFFWMKQKPRGVGDGGWWVGGWVRLPLSSPSPWPLCLGWWWGDRRRRYGIPKCKWWREHNRLLSNALWVLLLGGFGGAHQTCQLFVPETVTPSVMAALARPWTSFIRLLPVELFLNRKTITPG